MAKEVKVKSLDDCIKKCNSIYGVPKFSSSDEIIYKMFTPNMTDGDVVTTITSNDLIQSILNPDDIIDHLSLGKNSSLLNLFVECGMFDFFKDQIQIQNLSDEDLAIYVQENKKFYNKRIKEFRKCIIKQTGVMY